MPPSADRDAPRISLGVRQKFLAAVSVLVAAVLVVSAAALLGVATMAHEAGTLYSVDVASAQHSADLVAATLTVHESALYELATVDPATEAALSDEMDTVLLPTVQAAIAALRADAIGRADTSRAVNAIESGLHQYAALRSSGLTRPEDLSAAARSDLADQIDAMLEGIVNTAQRMNREAQQNEAVHKRELDATNKATRNVLLASSAGVLLIGLVVASMLTRNVVPRIREYADFASEVAAGRPTPPLVPAGHDELTVLGAALNDMVAQRDEGRASSEQETEFVEILQVIRGEDEAHLMIQRQLQRSVDASQIVVLTRNNSANRLEPATALDPGSELGQRLVGAEPAACVAVRLGRAHHGGGAGAALLSCAICAHPEGFSTCEPLLVSGEVIGSVLVTHPEDFDPAARGKVRAAVAQASPTLANLRNLALAEFRASNDQLTGLPNKRATDDTLKRMVAQANRSQSPLSAVMLDLDHFKEINDRFGHALGDEVLAAVGAAIESSVRDSDFAGRFGGEEFLLLFPDTCAQDALLVAEKVRQHIAAVTVPGVERYVSASLGVAALREHGGNASGLLRGADLAQYEAKATGRDRVVLASTPAPADDAQHALTRQEGPD